MIYKKGNPGKKAGKKGGVTRRLSARRGLGGSGRGPARWAPEKNGDERLWGVDRDGGRQLWIVRGGGSGRGAQAVFWCAGGYGRAVGVCSGRWSKVELAMWRPLKSPVERGGSDPSRPPWTGAVKHCKQHEELQVQACKKLQQSLYMYSYLQPLYCTLTLSYHMQLSWKKRAMLPS